MAGHQGYQFSTGLDQDLLYLVGHNDLDFHHLIGESFPKVGDDHLIANFQFGDIAEVTGTTPASMPGNNTIGVFTAQWDTGLAKVRSAIRQMIVSGSEIYGHLQFQFGYGDHAKDLIFQTIVLKDEAGFLISILTA